MDTEFIRETNHTQKSSSAREREGSKQLASVVHLFPASDFGNVFVKVGGISLFEIKKEKIPFVRPVCRRLKAVACFASHHWRLHLRRRQRNKQNKLATEVETLILANISVSEPQHPQRLQKIPPRVIRGKLSECCRCRQLNVYSSAVVGS